MTNFRKEIAMAKNKNNNFKNNASNSSKNNNSNSSRVDTGSSSKNNADSSMKDTHSQVPGKGPGRSGPGGE
jgi:hypothetical protein